MIHLIAAIDEHRALGKQGQLLCHLPLDLQHFKKNTLHQSIFMGRKTFDSIGHALPNRENFVLTHKKDLQLPGCICVNLLEDALAQKQHEHLWVIGGAEIYTLCLPFAEKILLTQIEHVFDGADTFFPELSAAQWKTVSEEFHPVSEKNAYPLKFVTYQKII
jgi:dihydrofolate reductase